MKAPTLGEAVIDLPWLAPGGAALAVLARGPLAAVWPQIRTDPGCVLLLARRWEGLTAGHPVFCSSASLEAGILETALLLLDQGGQGVVDWQQPGLHTIWAACLRQAQLAQGLAQQLEQVSPEQAWIGGLLAPLGWLAVSAVAPDQVSACLQDPRFPQQASAVQRQRWGLDHTAIARRLCRRWGLPDWLTALIGHLGLPADIAQNLGADRRLFQVVQLAVLLHQQASGGLGLAIGATADDLQSALGLTRDRVEQVLEQTLRTAPALPSGEPPLHNPLLRDLLLLALESRRQNDPPLLACLHAEVDTLQRALEDQCASEQERLQAQKLTALAELAAGAGHEINNPLAVISGQAQYLLRQLQLAEGPVAAESLNGAAPGPSRDHLRQSLQTIVSQTQRIHQILNELMQFARPPQPQRQEIEVGELLRAVSTSLQGLAGQRGVRLVCADAPAGCRLQGDPNQLHTALACLLRNAVEAAPPEGWAEVRVLKGTDHSWDLVVEDNGQGPTSLAREHLFDPFFSGRCAGRGRGLGLPTAWQLARQHGGNLWFDGAAPGLTRFVLRWPAAPGKG